MKEMECITRGHESMMFAHAKAKDNMAKAISSKFEVLLDQYALTLFSLNESQLESLDAQK